MIKKKIKEILKETVQFILNPRLLLCFGIGWIITNGWSYVMFALGNYFKINWMIIVSGAYLTFLWLPISPEKLVTVAIAIFLLRLLFPNDQKNLGKLRQLRDKFRLERKKSGKIKEQTAAENESEDP
ncbi:MAG: hypothetical protein IJC50_09860 [Clostridia bacterium]|nr:hypothetical protein [Clostridia bacterium]